MSYGFVPLQNVHDAPLLSVDLYIPDMMASLRDPTEEEELIFLRLSRKFAQTVSFDVTY